MRLLITFLFILFLSSCTLEKTDYEAEKEEVVTEQKEFKQVFSAESGDYLISIEALTGNFYMGYNEIRVFIQNSETKAYVNNLNLRLLTTLTDALGAQSSGPHSKLLSYQSEGDYYEGYAVFPSYNTGTWYLHLAFEGSNLEHKIDQPVTVKEQENKNLKMTAFTGNDGEQYYIALVAPQKPNVSENDLVAGIYVYNNPSVSESDLPDSLRFSYSEVKNYTLKLDPRMPEASMGNHSSPNNKDLTQNSEGLYQGVVNYTMTGNWTLNFILLNEKNEVIKGTEVPSDFTPGVEGIKSELFIDILF